VGDRGHTGTSEEHGFPTASEEGVNVNPALLRQTTIARKTVVGNGPCRSTQIAFHQVFHHLDAGPKLVPGRFPGDPHGRPRAAAGERNLSINFLVVKAVEESLERLVPVEELRLTRVG
jgi:hypothetical protein